MGGTVELADLGGVSVNGQDWQAGDRHGVRHAGLRLARTASGRSAGVSVKPWWPFTGRSHRRLPPRTTFHRAALIVDVGGASGNLLGHVLAKHPRPKGVLFDLPQAMTDAPARLRALGVEDRVTIQAGSAFEAVPPGADAYILSHVIHDWNEDQCLTILRNCRAAMTPTSRLLIIELVLREGNAPGFGSADMVMMTLTGGAERTAREFESLLARAGLTMTRVIPTTTSASIVEAQSA